MSGEGEEIVRITIAVDGPRGSSKMEAMFTDGDIRRFASGEYTDAQFVTRIYPVLVHLRSLIARVGKSYPEAE